MGQTMLNNCPGCQKSAVEKFRPFCSKRCAEIDLGRWLGEKYTVPTNEAPQEVSNTIEDDT